MTEQAANYFHRQVGLSKSSGSQQTKLRRLIARAEDALNQSTIIEQNRRDPLRCTVARHQRLDFSFQALTQFVAATQSIRDRLGVGGSVSDPVDHIEIDLPTLPLMRNFQERLC